MVECNIPNRTLHYFILKRYLSQKLITATYLIHREIPRHLDLIALLQLCFTVQLQKIKDHLIDLQGLFILVSIHC